MRNVELLQQTMQHIKDHPEQHHQDQWVNMCGTAACFAGWAAMLSGMTPGMIHQTRDFRGKGAKLLGITEDEAVTLFSGNNTRPMLELMVKDLVNGDELRPRVAYKVEAES